MSEELKNSGVNMEELASAKEERRLELQKQFSMDTYKVVRKELFAHLRDPAVTIRNGNITFNTACINGLEDVVYVKLLISEDEKKLAVQACDENEPQALRWCVSKPDKRKSRKMSCPGFTDLLFLMMGWDKKCRYKILGYRIEFEGETLYVFDLSVHEVFHEKPKKGEVAEEQATEETPVNTRKGYYPADIANTFGVSVEEHKRQTEVSEIDGFVSMAMLTGAFKDKPAAPVQEAGKPGD